MPFPYPSTQQASSSTGASGPLKGLPGGGGTGPPSARQPLPLWIGNVVHRFIQTAYRAEHLGHPVVCERRLFVQGVGIKSRNILDLARVPAETPGFVRPEFMHQTDLQLINLAFRTERNGYRRPDILNLRTREVFEIKPRSQWKEGLRYLAKSIALFNTYAAATRQLPGPAPPAGDKWQFLREIRDIRPGLWVPPMFVLVGSKVYVAFLAAPGLILYEPVKPQSQAKGAAQAMMQLRELEQMDQDMVAQTRLHSRYTTVARNTVLLVLAAMAALSLGPSSASLEGTIGQTAARGVATRATAARVATEAVGRTTSSAGRFARPRWDPGPGAGSISRGSGGAAAVIGPPLADEAAAEIDGLPAPPVSAARTLPRDEDEYISRVDFHFLANLPTTAPADEVLKRVEDGEYGASLDLPFYVQMLQFDDLARLLAALFHQIGGISQFTQAVFPLAAESPGEPEQLAEMLLDNRDFRLAWAAFRQLVEAPAEEVGVLTDEEYDAEIEPTPASH